jgi:hypothetical protein
MSQEVNNVHSFMGPVKKATKGHKFKKPRTVRAKKTAGGKDEEQTTSRHISNPQKELNAPRSQGTQEPQYVASTRFIPNPQRELKSPTKALKGSGKSQITAPGPTARASASNKAAAAKKGTKNTSTIRVARQVADLESPTPRTIYSITDAPRQWKKNG